MKRIWIGGFLLLSSTIWAAPNSEAVKQAMESARSCSNFVRYDDQNIYLGFGNYRQGFEEPRSPIPAYLTVQDIQAGVESAYNLNTADAAIDSVRDGDSLFVLTYSGIEEFNLKDKSRVAIYPTYAINGVRAYKEHAQGFARYQNKMILAHGRLGVSFFDLQTRRITNQFRLVQDQLPLESMATGVAVSGKYAYVVMDNFSLVSKGKPAFRGIVVIDLDSEKVVRQLDGMDPFADGVAVNGDALVVSFGGDVIWKYSIASLGGKTLPEPAIRIWRYPMPGHPTGAAVMDDTYYYTCFVKAPEKPGGFHKPAPAALNRKQLLLD